MGQSPFLDPCDGAEHQRHAGGMGLRDGLARPACRSWLDQGLCESRRQSFRDVSSDERRIAWRLANVGEACEWHCHGRRRSGGCRRPGAARRGSRLNRICDFERTDSIVLVERRASLFSRYKEWRKFMQRSIHSRIFRLPALSAAIALSGISGAPAQPAPAPTAARAPLARGPGVALALEAAETAVSTCTASGYSVSVTVLDAGGVTRLIYANDKAAGGPIDAATRKAYTALAFKESTADVGTQQAADPAIDAKI